MTGKNSNESATRPVRHNRTNGDETSRPSEASGETGKGSTQLTVEAAGATVEQDARQEPTVLADPVPGLKTEETYGDLEPTQLTKTPVVEKAEPDKGEVKQIPATEDHFLVSMGGRAKQVVRDVRQRYQQLPPNGKKLLLFGAGGVILGVLMGVVMTGRKDPEPTALPSASNTTDTLAAPPAATVDPVPAPTTPFTGGLKARVSAQGGLILRATPGGETVGGYSNGATVCVDPESATRGGINGLPFIRTADGNWVAKDFVSLGSESCP